LIFLLRLIFDKHPQIKKKNKDRCTLAASKKNRVLPGKSLIGIAQQFSMRKYPKSANT